MEDAATKRDVVFWAMVAIAALSDGWQCYGTFALALVVLFWHTPETGEGNGRG